MSSIGLRTMLALTALVCASCGDPAKTSTTTPSSVPATNFVTVPTTSTLPPAATVPGPQPEHDYEIQPDDLPITIASKFSVTLDSLILLNEWVLEGAYVTNFPGVGAIIRIPAGGSLPGETLPPTTPAPTLAPPVTTVAPCGPRDYAIEAGDYPIAVAQKFATTVDELNALNEDTPGYASFSVGTTITIPAITAC